MTRRPATLAFILLGAVIVACSHRSPLLSPTPEELMTPAPDSFRVVFQTTKGPFTAMAHRDWSPHGADRFYFLVSHGYYDDTYFFRVVKGYVAQWGISGAPVLDSVWRGRSIADDPVVVSNTRGRIAFARGGPRSRDTQLYVNYADNARLDTLNGFGFPPVAEVTDGMPVLDSLYSGYGDGPPRGKGPSQRLIAHEGNAYLKRDFPLLDRIITARVTMTWGDTLKASMTLRGEAPFQRGRDRRGGGGGGGSR
ncbi:MAG TPA: peptidylprolyl isomerase [Gemmatimonadaceae bacterium]|nr:peptidylprolyl isomerase [Gemmatimonadaceae bacterium]